MPSYVADQNDDGIVTLLQRKLFDHYHSLAYALIIGTYFIAFAEYLYLRLVSLIYPDRVVYKGACSKHGNETIVRNELHYASTTVVFLVMGAFQVVCFFLLTISSRWLTVRRTFRRFVSLEEKLRNELVFSIKRVMYATILPTFIVYSMCSTIVITAIFYNVGLRDPIVSKWSQIVMYLFDACVFVYFLSFPIVCLVYHPRIRCRLKMCSSVSARQPTDEPPLPTTTTQSAHLVAYRRNSNANSDPRNLQTSLPIQPQFY
ncbi:hypothetical protein M3Y94_01105000 [Aphelenchoides besseyi]|nr:hypothetical protein M3Y94_01105000 [Aphelenchoides besseyi]KAI6221573.1 hypothetical protein M3Y95_00976300 [Aphelenchoides besseyi]